ncbi:hypothetical protein [Pelosinus propionicus]|uniref:Uncharacterized protein n=1 Tax=Pelosinus propionicus DSM 13327 TaxID=1123291 RepID=A0A1I4QE74_9FIRM|nr:hypothetical protein [Pelosinus propionicus]SFM38317.1 hypothetical protein SAMN04490355_10966 [Pelosinus propionicus DSM 13327]
MEEMFDLAMRRVPYLEESNEFKEVEKKIKTLLLKTDNQELWGLFEKMSIARQSDIQHSAYLQGLHDGVLISNKCKR